jgi:hypothetical protein
LVVHTDFGDLNAVLSEELDSVLQGNRGVYLAEAAQGLDVDISTVAAHLEITRA